MTIQTERDRAEFEAWYVGYFGALPSVMATCRNGDVYENEKMQTNWITWKAAKASEAGSAQQAEAEPVRSGLWFEPPGYLSYHGAIRLDWTNDRHQRIELWGSRPSEVCGVMQRVALLIEAEIREGHLDNNVRLAPTTYTTPPAPAPVVPSLEQLVQWAKGWREYDDSEAWTTEDRILCGACRRIRDEMLRASSPQPAGGCGTELTS